MKRVATVLTLALVAMGVLWAAQRWLIYFPDGDTGSPASAGLPLAEPVAFTTDDGLRLEGWFLAARPPGSGYTVIVFNGNGGNRAYRAPLASATLLDDPLTNLQIVVGPALVLGLGQAAYIARMARSSLLEVIREDYVRTARAKGFGRHRVIMRHALPNALLPVITLSGILLGFVLAGSIPVERAFGTPGLGYAMFTAVNERDVFVMQNLVFLYAVVFVLLNIVIDITIAWIDPRIRYQ